MRKNPFRIWTVVGGVGGIVAVVLVWISVQHLGGQARGGNGQPPIFADQRDPSAPPQIRPVSPFTQTANSNGVDVEGSVVDAAVANTVIDRSDDRVTSPPSSVSEYAVTSEYSVAKVGKAPEGFGPDVGGANLMAADLRKQDLRGADLNEANLTNADLGGADLREANLEEANLAGANLSETNLQRAVLREAYFQLADLRGANLLGADMRMANVGSADLRGADLREVNLSTISESGKHYGTYFARSDLRGVDARGVDFTGVLLWQANLNGADLRGANLEHANRLRAAKLQGALYDAATGFHPEFDPQEHGMILHTAVDDSDG